MGFRDSGDESSSVVLSRFDAFKDSEAREVKDSQSLEGSKIRVSKNSQVRESENSQIQKLLKFEDLKHLISLIGDFEIFRDSGSHRFKSIQNSERATDFSLTPLRVEDSRKNREDPDWNSSNIEIRGTLTVSRILKTLGCSEISLT